MRSRLSRSLVAAAIAVSTACVPTEEITPLTDADGATTGGVLTVAISRPASVDPANAFDLPSELIARTMCDTLLTTDAVTGELTGGLAESWLVTDDGRQIVLRLRRDLAFSDGRPLTARDVVRSLSRAASPEFAGELADLLRPIAGWDELRGVVDTDVARHRRELAGVAAVGEHAVQITLREPAAGFLSVLTHPVAAPVADTPDAATTERPVCVGPYVLSEPWLPSSDVIVLERRDEHHSRLPGHTRGGSGWVDRIEFRVTQPLPTPAGAPPPSDADAGDVPQPEVAPPSLRGVDIALVEPRWWDDVGGRPAFALHTIAGPGLDYVGVPIPAADDTDARAVRQALSLAIDRERVAREVGGRTPATGFLPPRTGPAHRPDACPTAPASGDPARARRVLRSAAADLPSLRLVTTDEFRNLEVSEAVATAWREVLGIDVQLEVVTWTQLQQRATAVDGFDSAFRTSWSALHPGVDAYLGPVARSAAIGTTNWSRFSDGAVDEAITEDLGAAPTYEDLVVEAHVAEDLLCEHLPLIPVVTELRGWALRRHDVLSARTDSTVLDTSSALPRLRDLYLER